MAAPAHIARENGKKGGRPKAGHTIASEAARKYLVERVTAELAPILDAQIEAAKGLWFEKVDADGMVRIFREKPDIQAARNLLDQALGKAKESVEVKEVEHLALDL